MSSDGVRGNPKDMRRLAGELEKFRIAVEQELKRVSGHVHSVDWQDRKKVEFEGRFKAFEKSTRGFLDSQIPPIVDTLKKLAGILEEAQRVRFR